MYNPIHIFQDKRWNTHNQDKYRLIISFSEDTIRLICLDDSDYCICAETYHRPITSSHIDDIPTFSIQTFVNTHPFLAHKVWKEVICIISNKWYTLVPTALYEKSSITDYLKLAVDLPPEDVKLFDSSIDKEATIVFAIPLAIIHFLHTTYPQKTLYITHQANAIITSAQIYLGNRKRAVEPQVFLVTEGHYIYITIIYDAQLLYYNRFEYYTDNHWLECILTVIYTLALESEKPQLHFAGDFTKKTLIYKTLQRYISNLSFVQPPPDLKMRLLCKKDFLVHYFPLLNFGLYRESTLS